MNTLDKKVEISHGDKCGKCTNCKCINNEKFVENKTIPQLTNHNKVNTADSKIKDSETK
jgi:hypothetical protein